MGPRSGNCARCHAFAAEPSGLPCSLRPAAKACLSPNQPISSGRRATAAAASGPCRRATSPLPPSQAVGNCPSPMPQPLATLAAMSTKPVRTVCASACQINPSAGSRLLTVPRPGSVPINPQQRCPTQGRSGRPSTNGVFPTGHSWPAVTVSKRRFSDRALTASGHRQTTVFSEYARPLGKLRNAPPHSRSTGPLDRVLKITRSSTVGYEYQSIGPSG